MSGGWWDASICKTHLYSLIKTKLSRYVTLKKLKLFMTYKRQTKSKKKKKKKKITTLVY